MFKELERKCSGEKSKDVFPEHSFIANCLRVGLTINDLKSITWVDAMKIIVSFIPEKEKETNYRQATQADWDNFVM